MENIIIGIFNFHNIITFQTSTQIPGLDFRHKMTPELEKELKALRLRNNFDPKRPGSKEPDGWYGYHLLLAKNVDYIENILGILWASMGITMGLQWESKTWSLSSSIDQYRGFNRNFSFWNPLKQSSDNGEIDDIQTLMGLWQSTRIIRVWDFHWSSPVLIACVFFLNLYIYI